MILALALAVDATAVAAARGVAGMRRIDAVRLAAVLGIFAAALSAIGWGIGAAAARWVATWDHWLAFGLLGGIGAKMLVEAARGGADEAAPPALDLRVLLVLGLATSIDALAAGVTLPVLETSELLAVGLIGVTTFTLSLLGALGACRIGRRGGRALDALGGLALIAIGIKTLVEHLG